MVETLKFIYVPILLLSIFLAMIVSISSFPLMPIPCRTDKDCPKKMGTVGKCRKGYCAQM
ncbi:putative Late nodulin [Medicago truncatula]|uniref:Nodule Cysteine-Rich (NCR) secreted peptide n=1 Tax=Medicago truncatula TaxID=3880 RepID=A0A072TY77_MEDTR|nr:Nodule Cysteine-Rich (NCR) secreted peptide [Medicago truncatula]RHN45168.1 putative Late nodulin [Medicago truncatula]